MPPTGTAGDIPGGATPGAIGSAKPHEAQSSATAGQHSGNPNNAEGQGHQAGGPAGAKAIGRWADSASIAAAECCLRSLAATSALRLSAIEAAVLALHAGDGSEHHRHSAGATSQSLGPIHLRPQRRRHEEGSDRHLRGRLDAAQQRHAGHPRRLCVAAADGQRRTRRRRRERAARPLQHSGRDRYGRHLRHPAWLSEGAEPCGQRSEDVSGARHPEAIKAGRLGVVQLLVEHAEVHGLVPEGDVWSGGDQGERFLL